MKSFLANWKTTVTGAGMILLGVSSLLGVTIGAPMSPDAAIASIMGGLGLLFAKDGDVTGGTKPQ